MKNKKIIYKNYVQEKYLNLNLNKKLNASYTRILKHVTKNLDKPIDALHTLSNKFQFNFKNKDINQFKTYKDIVIIGMGGSSLGCQAIYLFLKKKNQKKFSIFR